MDGPSQDSPGAGDQPQGLARSLRLVIPRCAVMFAACSVVVVLFGWLSAIFLTPSLDEWGLRDDRKMWSAFRIDAVFGHRRIWQSRNGAIWPDEMNWRDMKRRPLPRWAEIDDSDAPPRFQHVVVASGWPWPNMRAVVARAPAPSPATVTAPGGSASVGSGSSQPSAKTPQVTWGVVVKPQSGAAAPANVLDIRVIPLRPLWTGLAADAGLLFVAVVTILYISGMLRGCLRKKRGQCVACGYRLDQARQSDVCPECGMAVKLSISAVTVQRILTGHIDRFT